MLLTSLRMCCYVSIRDTVFTRTIRASNNSRCSFLVRNNLNNLRCAARLFSFSNNSRFQLFNHHLGASACNFIAVRLSRCREFSWPTYWPLLCSCLPWPSRCCVAQTREFPSRQHREERHNALTSDVAYLHQPLTQIICVTFRANNDSFSHPLQDLGDHTLPRDRDISTVIVHGSNNSRL